MSAGELERFISNRWELELAIEATLDRHYELGCPIASAADVVCEMHGIVDDLDRRTVGDVAELRRTLRNAAVGVAA